MIFFSKRKNTNTTGYEGPKIDNSVFFKVKCFLKSNIFLNIIRLIALAVFIYSLYSIITWQKDNMENKKLMDSLYSSIDFNNTIQVTDENGATVDALDFSKLEKKNKDVRGWIKVNGTNIDYPIVQAKDNSYYLTHSFDKQYNSAGWIFLDYESNKSFKDPNTVVYGHNRKNNTMFSSLKKVIKEKWYSNSNNHIVTVYTPKKTLYYKVFSVYKIKYETYYATTDFDSNEEFSKFLKTIKKRSVYDFNVNVDESSKILTLSTCGDNKAYRIVLHGVLIN